MASLILIAIAGFISAFKDTMAHYPGRLGWLGWYFRRDWKRKYQKNPDGTLKVDEDGHYIPKKWFLFIKAHPAVFDAWHGSKVIQWGCVDAAASIHNPLKIFWFDIPLDLWLFNLDLNLLMNFIFIGIAWLIAFNVPYDTLFPWLKKKFNNKTI